MNDPPEDRIFARQDRVRGAALVVGVGALGGPLAEELAHLGLDLIYMVDPDVFERENFARHNLPASAEYHNKARALAVQIPIKLPTCVAEGIPQNFLHLPEDEQRRLVRNVDVVIDATGAIDCQHRVNRLCIEEMKPAVYFGMWVDRSVREGEVGEILWVDPRQRTPCFYCRYGWRERTELHAWRGARVDNIIVVSVAAKVVAGLLRPGGDYARMLDRQHTCIWVHTFTPLSKSVAKVFERRTGLRTRNLNVQLLDSPCPVCGAQAPPAPRQSRTRTPAEAPPPRPASDFSLLRRVKKAEDGYVPANDQERGRLNQLFKRGTEWRPVDRHGAGGITLFYLTEPGRYITTLRTSPPSGIALMRKVRKAEEGYTPANATEKQQLDRLADADDEYRAVYRRKLGSTERYFITEFGRYILEA